jgi:hypothetical protein
MTASGCVFYSSNPGEQSLGFRSSGVRSTVEVHLRAGVIIVQSAVVVRVDRHRLQRVVLLGPIAGHVLGCVPIAERKVFGLMANHQIIAGFWVAEESSRSRGW